MKKTWNRLLVDFFNGVVILLPITVTVILVRFLVVQVNNIVLNPIMKCFAPIIMGFHRIYVVKTLIFLIVISLITMIGWGAKILVVKRFFAHGEKFFIKLPFLGRIYNAAKQVFSALLGQGTTAFKQVVMLEYPRKGIFSLGFLTSPTKGEIEKILANENINVFVPTTPNPTSGIFLIVPREEVHFLKMSVEEGMKLIVSGGAVSPSYISGDDE